MNRSHLICYDIAPSTYMDPPYVGVNPRKCYHELRNCDHRASGKHCARCEVYVDRIDLCVNDQITSSLVKRKKRGMSDLPGHAVAV
jgi:hypothetical protein